MKNLILIPWRDEEFEEEIGVSAYRHCYGCFSIPVSTGICRVIASTHADWEHVSVSMNDRCPTFEEMSKIKEIFFRPGEIAFQVHPKKKDYVNVCETALHLWRPSNTNVPCPKVQEILNKYDFFGNDIRYRHGRSKDGEYVVIFDPNWSSWENVCKIKQEIFGDEVVLQYNISPELDLNDKHIIILWKHKNNFMLPRKELVY